MKWFEESDEVVINCGLDGKPRMSECRIKGCKHKIWAYACSENGVLKAVVKPITTLSTQYLTFEFSKNNVKIGFRGTPSFTDFIIHHVDESSFVEKNAWLKPVILPATKKFLSTAERPMKFKAK